MANEKEGIVDLNFGKDGSLSLTAREAKADNLDLTKKYQIKYQLKSKTGEKVGEVFSQLSDPKYEGTVKWNQEASYINVNSCMNETSLYLAL